MAAKLTPHLGETAELEAAWQAVEPATARRLLIAAIEAFAVRGYHATTTRDIASGAGLSPAGVYVYYRSKQELLYRITLLGHQATLGRLREALASEDDPAGQLQAVVHALAAGQARNHTAARVIEYELHSLSTEHLAEIAGIRREIDADVRGILERGVAAGVFDVADIRGTASAVLSLTTDVARWYASSARRPPEEIGRLYADLALRMVITRP